MGDPNEVPPRKRYGKLPGVRTLGEKIVDAGRAGHRGMQALAGFATNLATGEYNDELIDFAGGAMDRIRDPIGTAEQVAAGAGETMSGALTGIMDVYGDLPGYRAGNVLNRAAEGLREASAAESARTAPETTSEAVARAGGMMVPYFAAGGMGAARGGLAGGAAADFAVDFGTAAGSKDLSTAAYLAEQPEGSRLRTLGEKYTEAIGLGSIEQVAESRARRGLAEALPFAALAGIPTAARGVQRGRQALEGMGETGAVVRGGAGAADAARVPGQVDTGDMPGTWYSRLDRAIEGAPNDVATAEQWRAALDKAPEGVPGFEREWTGIDEKLAARGDEVISRDEVLRMAQERPLKLTETVRGKQSVARHEDELDSAQVRWRQAADALEEAAVTHRAKGSGVNNAGGSYNAAFRAQNFTMKGASTDEVVEIVAGDLKIPLEDAQRIFAPIIDELRESAASLKDVNQSLDAVKPKYAGYTIGGRGRDSDANYREVLIQLDRPKGEAPFTGGHYGDQNPDVVAHLRLTDEVGRDGARELKVHEVQSDLHQKGRQQGYADGSGRSVREIDMDMDALHEDRHGLTEEAFRERLNDLQAERNTARFPVPDTPFKNTDQWAGLGVRRAIQEAVDGGYERVVFTNADEQIRQYGTQEITWRRADDGTYVVDVNPQTEGATALDDMGGIEEAVDAGYVNPREGAVASVDDLRRLIDDSGEGEEFPDNFADKLWKRMQDEPDGVSRPREEGMRYFYDERIVPKALEQEAKRVGGTVVRVPNTTPETLPTEDWGLFDSRTGDEVGRYATEAEAAAARKEMGYEGLNYDYAQTRNLGEHWAIEFPRDVTARGSVRQDPSDGKWYTVTDGGEWGTKPFDTEEAARVGLSELPGSRTRSALSPEYADEFRSRGQRLGGIRNEGAGVSSDSPLGAAYTLGRVGAGAAIGAGAAGGTEGGMDAGQGAVLGGALGLVGMKAAENVLRGIPSPGAVTDTRRAGAVPRGGASIAESWADATGMPIADWAAMPAERQAAEARRLGLAGGPEFKVDDAGRVRGSDGKFLSKARVLSGDRGGYAARQIPQSVVGGAFGGSAGYASGEDIGDDEQAFRGVLGALAGAVGTPALLDGEAELLKKMVTARRAFMLTNPTTHAFNAASNALQGTMDTAARVPGAAFDRVLAGTVTGERALGGVSWDDLAAKGRGAATRGLEEARKVFKEGESAEELAKLDIDKLEFRNPVLGGVIEGTFRAMSAGDRPFYYAAMAESMNEQARLMAKSIATTPEEAKSLQQVILSNPPDQIVLFSALDAAEAVYRDPGKLRAGIKGLRDAVGNLGEPGLALFDLFVPFQSTPSNIVTRALQYTPLGFAQAGADVVALRKFVDDRGAILRTSADIGEQARHLENLPEGMEVTDAMRQRGLQRRASKAAGRATVGSGVLALGWYLWENDLWSGMWPRDDSQQRNEWSITDQPSGALRFGDKDYPLERLGPFAIILNAGAAMAKAAEEGGGTAAAKELVEFGMGQANEGSPYGDFQALTDLFGGGFAGFFGGLEDASTDIVGSVVPNMVSGVARGMDTTMRERRQDSMLDAVKYNLPGIRQTLPARVNTIGKSPDRGPGGAVGALQGILNPLPGRPVPDDPVAQAIVEYDASVPSMDARLRNLGLQKGTPEFEAASREMGDAVYEAIDRAMALPTWNMDGADRAALIEKAADKAKNAVRDRIQKRQGTS